MFVQMYQFFEAGSIGSVLLRGFIWLALMVILAAGVDKGKSKSQIKADAGWFFIFLFSFGIVGYWMFDVPILF